MPMKDPPHPGFSIKSNILDPLNLSVAAAAGVLDVSRHRLSRLVKGQARIKPDMAIRLEKAGWSNARFWLERQVGYDLAQVRKREHEIKVERYRV
ncbi:MAG: HigA family addiction module antitoxin [Acidobacteria bacterium]|nr:HigA family addiction module antitoxin [Acidobacteriota bacterium]MDA1233903.1 HigA family addiction module antitoxin [Acidobacteriota bacterium]